MSLFGNLKADGLEETQDRLGGYSPFDTDIYTGKIKMAYADKSDSGAQNVNLVVDINGKEYRETVYITIGPGSNDGLAICQKITPMIPGTYAATAQLSGGCIWGTDYYFKTRCWSCSRRPSASSAAV